MELWERFLFSFRLVHISGTFFFSVLIHQIIVSFSLTSIYILLQINTTTNHLQELAVHLVPVRKHDDPNVSTQILINKRFRCLQLQISVTSLATSCNKPKIGYCLSVVFELKWSSSSKRWVLEVLVNTFSGKFCLFCAVQLHEKQG